MRLDSLENVLDSSVKLLIYNPPNTQVVTGLLSEISKLEGVKYFEDIGRYAKEWLDYLEQKCITSLPRSDAIDLLRSVTTWRKWFVELLKLLVLYNPETKFIDVKKLVNGLKNLKVFFSDSELKWLTEFEKENLINALHCLLINRPILVEFSCIKVVESVLRRWYMQRTGKNINRKDIELVINDLINEYKNYSEQITLINYLEEVKTRVKYSEKVNSRGC